METSQQVMNSMQLAGKARPRLNIVIIHKGVFKNPLRISRDFDRRTNKKKRQVKSTPSYSQMQYFLNLQQLSLG